LERAKKARKVYSREYRIEAVRLTTESGISVVKAAPDLGLNENTLHNWRQLFRQRVQDRLPTAVSCQD
jgi:transposase